MPAPHSSILVPQPAAIADEVPWQRLAGAPEAAKYLSDESRRTGRAEAVALPSNTAQVSASLRLAREHNWPVTVSGARTGIAAGAVPEGGLVLGLERMNRMCGLRRMPDGSFAVRCEAGVVLGDLQQALHCSRFADSATWDDNSRRCLEEMADGPPCFYPPDPTETGASVGGTVACNASGAHTFRYGPTRAYVQWIEVVLADGSILELERGAHHADHEGRFALQRLDGSVVRTRVPLYSRPRTKNAAGYWSGAGMDLIDLFIGSEGTLGVITRADLRLVERPEMQCACVLFTRNESAALQLTRALRDHRDELGVEAIEYFGPRALALLRNRRALLGASSGVPACLPAEAEAALYIDVQAGAADTETVLQEIARLTTATGGDPERCWSAMAAAERERLRVFRHALPEAVNQRIADIRRTHPDVTKLGTDMAVPDQHLEAVFDLYRSRLDAAGLDYVIFGHVGDNHVHVNILPTCPDQYARGKELYLEFAREVVRMGGSVSAEHGVGKLKRDFLRLMLGEEGLTQMREVRAALDPESRLGRGTLFT